MSNLSLSDPAIAHILGEILGEIYSVFLVFELKQDHHVVSQLFAKLVHRESLDDLAMPRI